MKWTGPSELRQQVQKLWDKGELLAAVVTDEPLFPKRLLLKTPTATEMSEQFDAVRAWIASINALPNCRVVCREFKHRLLGANRIPAEIWLDSVEEAVAFIGKRRELARFSDLLDTTRLQQPLLLAWLAKKPLQALALSDDWQRLLAVVGWLQKQPRPDVYLRQIDLPGVHSKFIEAHRAVLGECFDLCLPSEAVNQQAARLSGFAERYGFRDKPPRVRFRVLDTQHALLPGLPDQDFTMTTVDFAALRLAVRRVFIVENEINFLAFPSVSDSLVVFGAGYGFAMLAAADWLACCELYYWSDIDTHGFAMLDQLRGYFPDVQSLLMDKASLLEHELFWGEESKPTGRNLSRLTADEMTVYDALRFNRIRPQLRLEQERIGYTWLKAVLEQIMVSGLG